MVNRSRSSKILNHIYLLIGIALVAFPIYVIIVASTHSIDAFKGTHFPLWFGQNFKENYSHLIYESGIGTALINSSIMALGITFGKIAISLLSAFAIVYFRFPFRLFFFWMIFITLMLPVEVRIVPTFEIVAQLNLLDSYSGLIIPLIASATATFLFRQFFMTIPPELVEAARIDGAGPWKFFVDILLPLSRTNIAALFVILFVYGWNQYLWPLLITSDESMYTIIISIKTLLAAEDGGLDWHIIAGTTVLAMIPPVFVVIAMQKLFVKGLVETEK